MNTSLKAPEAPLLPLEIEQLPIGCIAPEEIVVGETWAGSWAEPEVEVIGRIDGRLPTCYLPVDPWPIDPWLPGPIAPLPGPIDDSWLPVVQFHVGTKGDDRMKGDDLPGEYRGLDGDDRIADGRGDSVLRGNAGQDTLSGGGGDDTLVGGRGDDSLAGNNGDDVLRGGTGDDSLRGGWGDDTLTGGEGADVFIWRERGNDVITDFELGVDSVSFQENGIYPAVIVDRFARQEGDDVVITLGDEDGPTLTILNVALEDLTGVPDYV